MTSQREQLRRQAENPNLPWYVREPARMLLDIADKWAGHPVGLLPVEMLPLLPPQLPPGNGKSFRPDWLEVLRSGLKGVGPPLTITVHRWLPTDDDIYGSLYGPQALAARMFERLDPHWYLNGGDE